ncbi:MAG TPA: hypothetical protein VNZ45_16295, partial [Bacteroidia bacterium]|nr:hypothetical protein [Bacteroidia bacterium]
MKISSIIILFVTLGCFIFACNSGIEQSKVLSGSGVDKVDSIRKKSTSVTKTVDEDSSISFSFPQKIVSIDSISSSLCFVSERDGCVDKFNVKIKTFVEECDRKIELEGGSPSYIRESDSLSILSLNYEVSAITKINYLGKKYSLQGYYACDLFGTQVLMNKIEFINPSSKLYVYDLNSNKLDSFNARGAGLFFGNANSVIVFEQLSNGSTTIYSYEIKTGK